MRRSPVGSSSSTAPGANPRLGRARQAPGRACGASGAAGHPWRGSRSVTNSGARGRSPARPCGARWWRGPSSPQRTAVASASRTPCGSCGEARTCTCRKPRPIGWCCELRVVRAPAPARSSACRSPRGRSAWGSRWPRAARVPAGTGPRGRAGGGDGPGSPPRGARPPRAPAGRGRHACRRNPARVDAGVVATVAARLGAGPTAVGFRPGSRAGSRVREASMRFAERMGGLTTAASFDMLARGPALEAKGRSIIHLGIGEPDFDTPGFIRKAADAALAAGWTHYGPAAGLPEFRQLIAKTWRARRGIACEAANVVVTPGAKPVLFFAMLATLEPGDEVLIPSPAFPTYASVAEFLGARVVPVPLVAARGFDLDLAALRARITARSRMLVLNSPHNPTGGVLPPATLAAIAELVREHDLLVVSDEIYSEMVYEGESPSIATLPGMAERTVVVDGFSKTYAMTGWGRRVGDPPEPAAP